MMVEYKIYVLTNNSWIAFYKYATSQTCLIIFILLQVCVNFTNLSSLRTREWSPPSLITPQPFTDWSGFLQSLNFQQKLKQTQHPNPNPLAVNGLIQHSDEGPATKKVLLVKLMVGHDNNIRLPIYGWNMIESYSPKFSGSLKKKCTQLLLRDSITF